MDMIQIVFQKVGKQKFEEFLIQNETNLISFKVNLLNDFKGDPVKKSEMIFDIVDLFQKYLIQSKDQSS